MIIVGICGASGSGKSTLAEEIKSSLSCSAVIIGQDCYYRNHAYLPVEERQKINYDAPEVFDYDELRADMQLLEAGMPITKKGYDYANHCRADSDELIQPPDVVILEGIHVFHDARLMEKMHVDIDVCLLRRIERDIVERGRTIDNIGKQYMATVRPMYEEYISKYIRKADFAVMHGGHNRLAIDAISAYISAELWKQKVEAERSKAAKTE